MVHAFRNPDDDGAHGGDEMEETLMGDNHQEKRRFIDAVHDLGVLYVETERPIESHEPLRQKHLTALISVLFYCSTSLSVVFFNKWLFERQRYPVFISWVQQIVSLLIFSVCSAAGCLFPRRLSFLAGAFPASLPNISLLCRMLPLAFSFVFMVAAANACLQIAPVSTYQVTRSLTLVFTIIFSAVILRQRITIGTVGACLCVFSGFVIVASDTHNLQWQGATLGALSSLFQATYQVLIKRYLPIVDENHTYLLACNTLLACFIFPPFIFIAGEGKMTFAAIHDASNTVWASIIFWTPLVISGLLSALLNVSSFWCVKTTSPLTFNIAGIAKAAVQALGGLVILGDPFSVRVISGISLKLLGSSAYTCVKFRESVKIASSSEADAPDIQRLKQTRLEVEGETENVESNRLSSPSQRSPKDDEKSSLIET